MKTIVLMGNPNVGKSVIFSRLTGVHVTASNYPGTTVGFTQGYLRYPAAVPEHPSLPLSPGEKIAVIDAPGIYSTDIVSRADRVAVELLKKADLVLNVIDATNLERNLYLTMQLLEEGIPMVVALNLWDETKHRGISIDSRKLEMLLGVPVTPTVGLTGRGIRELVNRFPDAQPRPVTHRDPVERWGETGRIIRAVQTLTHHHHTLLERLEDLSVRPASGLAISALVIYGCFKLVRVIGESIIGHIMDPLFERVYAPMLMKLSSLFAEDSIPFRLLIGQLVDHEIDFVQSFGLLTTGLYVPIAMVFPYIVAFYLILGFLEDFGFLPRLAVLLDMLLHRLGLHGYAIIPNMLGLGCNVPGILATRILESRRERFIACTLISIGVPCAALQAMIFGLVGQAGGQYVALIYLTLFSVWLAVGFMMNLTLKGFSPELILEIPPYRIPAFRPLLKKLWSRIYGFLREALPVVLGGVAAINLLYAAGIFSALGRITAPVISGLLGLPEDAITPLLIGFLRKDMAVGLLATIDPSLSAKQLVIASTVLAMFFPCIATFTVLTRELGIRDMCKATLIMITASLTTGMLLNLTL